MPNSGTGTVLILMAKAPLPGLAKSRLVDGGLDPVLVARLADAFLRDTLDLCARADGARLLVAYAPRAAEAWFRTAAPSAELVPQVEGDLGTRIAAAFEAAFARGALRAIAIGTDTPHLPAERLSEAWAALESNDCVLGPASDGGYYLVGLRRPRPQLFAGIAWSTPRVLAETLERARALWLRTITLREESDVDERADLDRLSRALVAAPGRAPRTARVLREELPAAGARPPGSGT
jgi:rSAM/selenodomain-associated transferase 1